VRGDARLSASSHLAVYANAYFERIHGCLEGHYPALRWALGEEWFRDRVTAYLIAHPSRHPSLRFAGSLLPGYLTADSRAEPFRRGRPWLPDRARRYNTDARRELATASGDRARVEAAEPPARSSGGTRRR
jgi:Putative DNA-binding domain